MNLPRTASIQSALSAVLFSASMSTCAVGCAAIGFAVGSAADSSRTRAISVSELESVERNAELRVYRRDGAIVSGRFESASHDDRIVLSDGPRVASIPLGEITRIESRSSTFRWLGGGFGLMVDAAVVSLVIWDLSHDATVRPAGVGR